jgi:uncharacterized protein (UPF0297 family)
MDNNSTNIFDSKDINNTLVSETLNEAVESLEERGYNSINQLVGYLISGDPGYISNYKETRKKLSKIDRTDIIEVLLRSYLSRK